MEVFQNHPLAPYTTLKIGGPADTFILTKTSPEFIDTLKSVVGNGSKPFPTIIGNGSNVLISDSGIRGTVIKNDANKIEYLPGNRIKVDSSVQLTLLINDTVNHSLAGLEEFAYIPASIGGAIVGNIHGINKNNFDKFVESIEVFDLNTGHSKTMSHSDLKWSYDFSSLQDQKNLVVVSSILQLATGDTAQLKQAIIDNISKKIATQSMNSLGCVFKNPENDSAGRIIDQELGLKGFRLNNIQVSEKHANFILNLGGGTATDYYSVIKKIQTEAESKGIILEPEIKFLGDFN